MVPEVETILLQQLLRIHMEVEDYHLASFTVRANNLPPVWLKEAVESLKSELSVTTTKQLRTPLGIFSPYLWDDERRQQAISMLNATPTKIED